MYIADHLSRASVKDTGTPDEDFQVFAVELEGIGPLNTIRGSFTSKFTLTYANFNNRFQACFKAKYA
jgi:hypothetical protein